MKFTASAEVVVGDLADLQSVHLAIEGCKRIYFSMSVSAAYLEATVNFAAVARHRGVEAIVNMSQMSVKGMSITGKSITEMEPSLRDMLPTALVASMTNCEEVIYCASASQGCV